MADDEQLTTDQMIQIMVDLKTGRKPRVTGHAADVYRAKVAAEIEQIEASGGQLLIPNELPG